MKVCPVCSESFADDLKFCDLDGTRLTRQLNAAATAESGNKLWSMLGIGLLVGALVISAVSVFMIPKARVATPMSSSESQASASSSKPSGASTDNTMAASTTEQPEIVVTEGPLPDAKKKEKLKTLTDANSNAPALDPKAAAQGGETEKPAQPAAQPASVKPEPTPAVKTVSETREPEPAAKPAVNSPDPKKDPKSATANSSKDSDKKKNDDKDKKKGGFFKVFKKIFGKD